MKKVVFLVLSLLLLGQASYAQKFGYVDSEFILSKMPAFAAAQKEVDKLAENWQRDIETRYKEIDKLHKSYQAEEVLLTEEMKKKRQNEIAAQEQEVKEYQKRIFGFEGLLFRKRQELIKPVQDEVYDAIEKVAKQRQLQIVFDKSGALVMLYTNPVHDYTEYVLEALGLASPEKNAPGTDKPTVNANDTPGAATQPDDMAEENAVQPGGTNRKPAASKAQPNSKTQNKKK
ncbi:OmpH family outer membrane protein [Adhaeribacter rhizoryzae]|uniref:OmpH family outer membrane protein n=1 Tax=Adhaeribacter rhizoryzae TaxID=2607907 RepID=A0A5M6D914_9BACT|nr:OmpH family outer membrane protein [Adhaeribacter rhizoryzae]KAA5543991.1 OmpH family outer membrane protein [Adhaeribacter rhizoryzae]